jgi:hypothetical protein
VEFNVQIFCISSNCQIIIKKDKIRHFEMERGRERREKGAREKREREETGEKERG